ncbi:POTRA domain-containing protein [Algoriphagus limi]|uniref:BamA/TamA family outer membrane protein n=1 Tax=Algoriphagus limi TaxID=2975273 RepID=A0ABT2G5W7_9BACT|nr:BamA/TamA family outer membrane protein [Algoriphagus limi]MCS5490654.1 BamA/TamA family outer membrane protein [Algoriphagus limi]
MSNSAFSQHSYWLGWRDSIDRDTSGKWKVFEDSLQRNFYLDSLVQKAWEEGYLGAAVDRLEEQGDSLLVKFYQGPKIEQIHLKQGNLSEDLVMIPSDPLSFTEVNQIFIDVLEKAENTGFPFAYVRLDSLERVEEGLRANLKLNLGPQISWDTLQIEGNSVTKGNYLQRLSRLEIGTPFSQKELEQATKRIGRSPYFRLASPPQINFRLQKASPVFQLSDRNSNVLDGILGVLPNENQPGKVLITGQLDLELYHLGGKGRDVSVHWQRFNELTQRLELEVKESFVFGSGLDVSGEFSLLKQDTSFINRRIGVHFGYQSKGPLYFDFFLRRQAGDLISTTAYSEVTELPETADFRWSEYGLHVTLDLLDDVIAPRKGAKIELGLSAGNKEILQNTGIPEEAYQGLDLRTPQYSIAGKVEKHFYLKRNWGIYWGAAAGLIRNENLLQNDLYRLGGLQSIRGFNENFFFARDYFYMNLEPRLFFGENSFLFLFSDLGLLENPYFADSIEQAFSFGSGISFETDSGVFRFVYAVGKTKEQPLSLQFSKIHFGYLVRF